MLPKVEQIVSGYCFGLLELFCSFFERTHVLVGVGVPLSIMATVHLFLPTWVGAAIFLLVLAPAAAAMVTVAVHGLLLNRNR